VIDVLMWPTECVPGVCCANRKKNDVRHFTSLLAISLSLGLRCNIAFLRCQIYNRRNSLNPPEENRKKEKKNVIMQQFLWDFFYCSRRHGYTNRDREGSLFFLLIHFYEIL